MTVKLIPMQCTKTELFYSLNSIIKILVYELYFKMLSCFIHFSLSICYNLITEQSKFDNTFTLSELYCPAATLLGILFQIPWE